MTGNDEIKHIVGESLGAAFRDVVALNGDKATGIKELFNKIEDELLVLFGVKAIEAPVVKAKRAAKPLKNKAK